MSRIEWRRGSSKLHHVISAYLCCGRACRSVSLVSSILDLFLGFSTKIVSWLILRSDWWVTSTSNFSLKLVIVKTEHVIRNTLFIHLWLCVICKCSSCHCLIHDVMLCSQNKDLYSACKDGKVTRVKELLSLGADPNHHSTGEDEVSCVWLCCVEEMVCDTI